MLLLFFSGYVSTEINNKTKRVAVVSVTDHGTIPGSPDWRSRLVLLLAVFANEMRSKMRLAADVPWP